MIEMIDIIDGLFKTSGWYLGNQVPKIYEPTQPDKSSKLLDELGRSRICDGPLNKHKGQFEKISSYPSNEAMDFLEWIYVIYLIRITREIFSMYNFPL